MKNAIIFGLAAASIATPTASAGGWIAYNDSVDIDPNLTPANATNFGLGRSYLGEGDTGKLLDFETGEDTGVLVTFKENFSTGSINWATDFAGFTPGSDAAATFEGILDLSGNMSYGDDPGWSLELVFSDLDPDVSYTFAATVHRNGGGDYAGRVTNWLLSGAEGATYASSAEAHKIDDFNVEFSTGDNTAGLVARWTDIQPGADGSFTIRTSHGVGAANGGIPGADAYRGYAGGLFMLEAQSDGVPLMISSVDYDSGTNETTLTWPTSSNRIYAIDVSEDFLTWSEIVKDLEFESETATYVEEDVMSPSEKRFYRLRIQ
jgi:hypothetical protein